MDRAQAQRVEGPSIMDPRHTHEWRAKRCLDKAEEYEAEAVILAHVSPSARSLYIERAERAHKHAAILISRPQCERFDCDLCRVKI